LKQPLVGTDGFSSSSLIILAISEALFSSNNNLKTAVSCLENFCDLKQLLI
jgi:hypothetical protein